MGEMKITAVTPSGHGSQRLFIMLGESPDVLVNEVVENSRRTTRL